MEFANIFQNIQPLTNYIYSYWMWMFYAPKTFIKFVKVCRPELLKQLNTLDDYRKIRTLLKEYGVQRLYDNEIAMGQLVFDGEAINAHPGPVYPRPMIAPYLPFTFFYEMESVDGPDQVFIPKQRRDKYVVLRNIPELGGMGPGEIWDTAKENHSASMSMYHQFVGVRQRDRSLFNALTFGIESECSKGTNNYEVIELLDDFEEIANNWADHHNIPREHLGCYFHIYPTNSVQSLHMHMVDTRPEHLGAAWYDCEFKNMSLSVIRDYFS